ncbi:hypothetical protein CFI10_08205 [Marinobacterium iners]|jgi:hypothetical protein|uniref:Uncharacterized protein n=1 Tax=Marinobacterium iners DSM 11526 TaxID=1122198 RepID=A0A1H4F9H8_9GAMM|nr:hypothetical protein [Marinobacterium iners]QSR34977.1 hypothetical protein CFI10_08205 [Marinobacterium iners]SEA93448.1 hypothetical protein SAMN02745729_11090 [Marinobacterium iners DSM 11526]
MKERTRAKVAATVAAATLNTQVLKVTDLDEGTVYRIRALMRHGRVDGFDCHSEHHFKGMSSHSMNFYDYEAKAHVHLKLVGSKILGYDLATETAFNGQVHGRLINLYDYETEQTYRFTV